MRYSRCANMWSDEDFGVVLEVAQRDRDERNRKNAAFLLREHPLQWRQLVKLWHQSELPRERAWVCELLADHGDTGERQLLEVLRKDPNGHAAQRAEEALLALENRGE